MYLVQLLTAALLGLGQTSAFGLGKHNHNCKTSPMSSCIANHPIAFQQMRYHHGVRHSSNLFASGGFGGGAPSAKGKKGGKKGSKQPSSKKMNPKDAKRANQQLLERYGGDLGKGTQDRIQASLESLEPHIREAAELYKSVAQFDGLVAPMTTADRNRLISPAQTQMAEDDRKKMNSIMQEHELSENDLHNVYQRFTWDASADAKATKADMVGNKMKAEFQERITKACAIAVEATQSEGALGKVLDIGCGHGAIVPTLVDAGLAEPDMFVGIDLSSEMVDQAVKRYGSARNGRTGKGRVFVADDFLTYDFGGDGVFDSVIFCSALHDLPDMEASIEKASSLLRAKGGKIVVVHAQGAQHVLGQNNANPVMVKRGLPTTKEWAEMISEHDEWSLTLEVEPADARSDREIDEGYLAVLSKI